MMWYEGPPSPCWSSMRSLIHVDSQGLTIILKEGVFGGLKSSSIAERTRLIKRQTLHLACGIWRDLQLSIGISGNQSLKRKSKYFPI